MATPFKCEHSMFLSLQDRSRRFDLRRWDLNDKRIYRLAWQVIPETDQARVPEIQAVSFADKETGEMVTFQFKGLAFAPWAPGWVFILLGQPIELGTCPRCNRLVDAHETECAGAPGQPHETVEKETWEEFT